MSTKTPPSVALNVALAGSSNMAAAFFTNPIDVIKVRMQLQDQLKLSRPRSGGFLTGASKIIRAEGIGGLYKGLTASLAREGSYSSIRLGLYDPMKELLGATGPSPPLTLKVIAGALTGVLGSGLANPIDLIKIRMQGDVKGDRYPSFRSAFRQVLKAEGGVRGLFVGVAMTTQRAALLTGTQIPSYDHSKYVILSNGYMEEGLKLHMACSMFAGFMTATITSPVDVIRTRIMNERKNASSTYVGRSTLRLAGIIIKSEGLYGLYKGWFPNWMRIGPHTIISFLIYEQLRLLLGIKPI